MNDNLDRRRRYPTALLSDHGAISFSEHCAYPCLKAELKVKPENLFAANRPSFIAAASMSPHFVYVCTYIHRCMHLHKYIYILYLHIHTYVRTVCVYIYICIYIYIYICVCMYRVVYLHLYVTDV